MGGGAAVGGGAAGGGIVGAAVAGGVVGGSVGGGALVGANVVEGITEIGVEILGTVGSGSAVRLLLHAAKPRVNATMTPTVEVRALRFINLER